MNEAQRQIAKAQRESLELSMLRQLIHYLPAPGWIAQYCFHPTRKFRFDIASPNLMLGIEVNGGQWRAKGAHNTGLAVERDAIKAAEAAVLGWVVLAFPGSMVEDGRALVYVDKFIQAHTNRRVA